MIIKYGIVKKLLSNEEMGLEREENQIGREIETVGGGASSSRDLFFQFSFARGIKLYPLLWTQTLMFN